MTALRDLIAAVRPGPAPEFGVLLGDTVRRASRRRYAMLQRALRRAAPPFPVVAVPGNRDHATDDDWFVRALGSRTWAIRRGDVAFVGVDNADGPLTPASLSELARAPVAACLIVFAHQPFHVPGEPRADARWRQARSRELRAAVSGRRIDAVFSGHLDLWQEIRDDEGTLHVVNGHVPGPGGAIVPTAAVVTAGSPEAGGVTVRRIQVPRRVDVLDAAWRAGVVLADHAERLVARPRASAAGNFAPAR